MKAMLFAAGLGTRLGALTKICPKALVPVGGQTMLDLVVARLKAGGVTELMINLHYRGEMIREYVAKRKAFGLQVEFSEEAEILGTGGGLKKVEKFFSQESEFLVHNCDVYSDIDLPAMLAAHRADTCLGTLAVIDRKENSYFLFDSANSLIGWEMADKSKRDLARDDPKAQRRSFTGIQILSPGIFEYMRSEPAHFAITKTYVGAARAGKQLKAFSADKNFWIDVGTPEDLEVLRQRLG
jgi:NDP-sugar pyrophosphorylase family protein